MTVATGTALAAELTTERVAYARRQVRRGRTIADLATELGVQYTTMRTAVRGVTWHACTEPAVTRAASTVSVVERIMARTAYGAPGDCWEWLGERALNGYGKLCIDGTRIYAHRLVWELHNGTSVDGWVIRHSCDYPACVNPAHLLRGTHGDNMRDMVERGRSTKGVEHWNAVLTEQQVVRARREVHGGAAISAAAAALQQPYQTVWDAVRGNNWGWLTTPPPVPPKYRLRRRLKSTDDY